MNTLDNDRRVLAAQPLPFPDSTEEFPGGGFFHISINDDGLRRVAIQPLPGFVQVFSTDELELRFAEVCFQTGKSFRVRFNQQHRRPAEFSGRQWPRSLGHIRFAPIYSRDFRVESGSPAWFALHPYHASKQDGQVTAQGQTQSCAAVAALKGVLDLGELLKDGFLVLRSNADAAIADAERNTAAF